MDYEQPRWRFARMTRAEINQDPVQGEFFSREADLPGRLVREAVQNSLDARRDPGQPVRVRFVFSGERDALPPGRAKPYLEGLQQHVEAVAAAGGMSGGISGGDEDDESEALYDALSCFEKPLTYLVVEDFGTTGLTGDILRNSEREPGNDFWGFFRSIGISPKGEDAAGSWGLGKWVFPDASILNAYLGMTQRQGEDNWLLMGMALLKTHHIGENKHRYYGSFAAHSEEPDERWFPLPVESDDFVQETVGDFNLERLEDPGLSVIVPFPKDELKPAEIARAVLTQYFLPIVRGDLAVEIVHPEEGNRTISADTISAEVGRIEQSNRDDESAESLRRVIELAGWAVGTSADTHVELPVRNLGDRMEERADLAELRERYGRGERLAFRLTLDVRDRSAESRTNTSFRVYLERDEELSQGHDYFMRGPLRIPRMDHIERQQARALVLVDDKSPLGHMLRDAEGPAHESWDPHAQRLKDRWIGGYQRVQDVRRAAVHLLHRLVERPAERQMDALADLFPGDPSQFGKGRSQRRGSRTGLPQPLPSPRPASFQIDAPTGRIVARRSPQAASVVVGQSWEMRFAYDTVRGNPFGTFDRGVAQGAPDFSLLDGDLHLVEEGCAVEKMSHNSIHFAVKEEGFRITLSGFDQRDVKVELREIRIDAGEEGREDAT